MTLEEQNKAVVRQYVEAFNRGDLEGLRSLLADDAEIQGVMGRGLFDRIAPIWRQLIEGYGMQLRIEELVAKGNRVAARYTETGPSKHPPSVTSPPASRTSWSRWSCSRSKTARSGAAGAPATPPPRPASSASPSNDRSLTRPDRAPLRATDDRRLTT